jgi:restriction endonuclease Mrr
LLVDRCANEIRKRKIVLTNGTELAKHMIAPNLGVSVSRSYEVNRLDTDRFGEG